MINFYSVTVITILACIIAGISPWVFNKYESTKKYASKKFSVACLLLAAVFYLTYTGNMQGTETGLLFGLIGSGYSLANLADKKTSKENDVNNTGFQSRKYIIMLAIIACATILGSSGKLSSMQLMMAYGLAGGAYGFANTKEKNI